MGNVEWRVTQMSSVSHQYICNRSVLDFYKEQGMEVKVSLLRWYRVVRGRIHGIGSAYITYKLVGKIEAGKEKYGQKQASNQQQTGARFLLLLLRYQQVLWLSFLLILAITDCKPLSTLRRMRTKSVFQIIAETLTQIHNEDWLLQLK